MRLQATMHYLLHNRGGVAGPAGPALAGVRGVSDSPEGMTPQSLAPKDQLTPPWRK